MYMNNQEGKLFNSNIQMFPSSSAQSASHSRQPWPLGHLQRGHHRKLPEAIRSVKWTIHSLASLLLTEPSGHFQMTRRPSSRRFWRPMCACFSTMGTQTWRAISCWANNFVRNLGSRLPYTNSNHYFALLLSWPSTNNPGNSTVKWAASKPFTQKGWLSSRVNLHISEAF